MNPNTPNGSSDQPSGLPNLERFLAQTRERSDGLLAYLEASGRKGVIVETDENDHVVLGSTEQSFGEPAIEDGVKITRSVVMMNGQRVGIMQDEMEVDERGHIKRDGYMGRTFIPNEGVNVFDAKVIENELK